MKLLRALIAPAFLFLLCRSAQAQESEAVLVRLRSDSAVQRVSALRQLARMPADLRAGEEMLAALRDPSAEVRREALATWGRVAIAYDDAVFDAAVPRRQPLDVQERAGLKAEQRWQKEFIAAVAACAADPSNTVRREAVRTLARLGPDVKKIIPPYYGECGVGAEWPLDYKAGECLTAIGKEHPKLLYSLASEPDQQIAFAVTQPLAEENYPPVFPILKSFLRRPDPLWRMIGIVGFVRKPDSLPILLPLLSDPDTRVRECAISYLSFHHRDEFDKVRARLTREFPQPNAALRWSVVHLTVRRREEDYLAFLKKACADQDDEVLALALGTAKDQKIALPGDQLRALLKHPHPPVRGRAAQLLWQQEKDKAIPTLLPLLEDPEESVGDMLVEELCGAADPRLPAPLLKAFRGSKKKRSGYFSVALSRMWRYSHPLMLPLTRDKDARMRALAASVFGDVLRSEYRKSQDEPESSATGDKAELLAALAELSRDSEAKVRVVVAEYVSISGLWDHAQWAVPIILRMLEDNDKQVCLITLQLLQTPEDPQQRNPIEAVVQRLSANPDKEIRQAAEAALDHVFSDAE